MGDVEQSLGLAVDVTKTAGEGTFDEVDAVVGLLEAEGLVGKGTHHPGGVAVWVGFAGQLVTDLVVALGGPFLAEVMVLPACQVREFGHGAEGRTP